MRTQHFTTLAMIALLAAVSTSTNAAEDHTFRGVIKDQGNNVINSSNGSNAMGHRPWFIDIKDDFNNRTGSLDGSEAHPLQVGFLPAVDTRDSSGNSVQGELTGTLADEHGRWVGDGSYLVNGGHVQRSNMTNPNGVATLPWRVVPGLGDDYLGEANVTVAAGESVAIAFTGDADNTSGVMDGEYGQLALQVSRDASNPTDLSWQVMWDTEDAAGFGTDGDLITVPEGEIRLQLAWNEVMNTFDAWLDDTQLKTGTFGQGGISVHGYSIYLGGTGSTINSALNAVPEPSSLVLLATSLIGLFGFRNRK